MGSMEKRRGFTLIELIVVIAIIVILIALIAPNAAKLIGTARQTKADSNARSVFTAAQALLLDKLTAGETVSQITLEDIKDYITSDAAAGVATISIGDDGLSVYFADWSESATSDVVGRYPRHGSSESITNAQKGLTAMVSSPEILKTLDTYFSGKTEAELKQGMSLDSQAKVVQGSTEAKIIQEMERLGFDMTGSDWRFYCKYWETPGNTSVQTSKIHLYWTTESIAEKKQNDKVTAIRYVYDFDTGTFKYDSVGEVPITSSKDGNYNVLYAEKYKAQ